MEATPGTDEYTNLWHGFSLDFKKHLKNKGWLEITTLALDDREQEEMSKPPRLLAHIVVVTIVPMHMQMYTERQLSFFFFSWWVHTMIGHVAANTLDSFHSITER